MLQLQRCGVQKIPGKRKGSLPTAKLAMGTIQHIPDNRMSKRGQMHANLMGASGVDLYVQQAKFPERRIDLLLHLIMADGFPSTRPPRGHTGAAHPVAA